MPKPFFSIILPVYNTEAFLKQCLESVVNQKFQDFECIIINDGSPNKFNNPKSVEEIYKESTGNGDSSDSRFKYLEQKNSGVSVARNNGIDIATGEFVIFLDSDDMFHSEHLEKLRWLLTNIDSNNWTRNIFFQKDLMPFHANENGEIELLPSKQPVIEQRSKTRTNFLKELVYFSINEPMLILNRELLGDCRMKIGIQGGEGPGLINQIILTNRLAGKEIEYCELPLTQTYLYRMSLNSFTQTNDYKLQESNNYIALYREVISHQLSTRTERVISEIAILRYKLNVYNNIIAKITKKFLTLISKILVKY